MEILEMLRMIYDSGVTLVITAIFLTIYLKNEKARSKRAEEAEDRRITQELNREKMLIELLFNQDEKLSTVIHNTRKTHTPEEDELLEKINYCINEVLTKLRESTAANRAIFMRYHNGSYDLNNVSTIKMSVTNESVSVGVEPHLQDLKDLPRSFFTWWCNEIRTKETVFIEDIEDIREADYSFYAFLKNRNVYGLYGQAVKNIKEQTIGFVLLEYTQPAHISIERIAECLDDKAKKISTLIGVTEMTQIKCCEVEEGGE